MTIYYIVHIKNSVMSDSLLASCTAVAYMEFHRYTMQCDLKSNVCFVLLTDYAQ